MGELDSKDMEDSKKVWDAIEDYPVLSEQQQEICNYILEQQREFENKLEKVDTSSFEEVMTSLPRWFLALPLRELELPTRGRNVIRAVTKSKKDGSAYLSDLEGTIYLSELWDRGLSSDDLLARKNFGSKSLAELSRALVSEARSLKEKHVCAFLGLLSSVLFLQLGESEFSVRAHEKSMTSRPGPFGESLAPSLDEWFAPDSLQEAVQSVLDRHDPEETEMLKDRWREWDPPRSYGKIGEDYGTTKTKAWKAISTIKDQLERELSGEIDPRIQSLLSSRDDPLKLHLLGIEDDWFQGFSDQLAFLGNLVETVTSDEFSVILIGGQRVVAQTSQDEWENLQGTTVQFLSEELRRRDLTREDAKLLVANKAHGRDIPELLEPLWEKVRESLYFEKREDDADILLSVGEDARAAVKAVLMSADQTLDLSTIINRSMSDYDFSISRSAARDNASDLGARYGRSTYGSWDHFPIGKDDRQRVLNIVHEVVATADKQWHTHELLDELEKRDAVLAEPLDKYLLDSILGLSDRMKPIGRMLWIREGSSASEDPIEIGEAVTAVLEKAGGTLSRKEIREEVEKHRGLGSQINPNQSDRAVRIARGEWGLIDRDLNLSSKERKKARRILRVALEKFGKGLLHRELPHILSEMGFPKGEDVPGVGLMEYVGSHPGFDENNKYLYLAEWDGPRR